MATITINDDALREMSIGLDNLWAQLNDLHELLHEMAYEADDAKDDRSKLARRLFAASHLAILLADKLDHTASLNNSISPLSPELAEALMSRPIEKPAKQKAPHH